MSPEERSRVHWERANKYAEERAMEEGREAKLAADIQRLKSKLERESKEREKNLQTKMKTKGNSNDKKVRPGNSRNPVPGQRNTNYGENPRSKWQGQLNYQVPSHRYRRTGRKNVNRINENRGPGRDQRLVQNNYVNYS